MKRAIICIIAVAVAVPAAAEFPQPRNLPQVAGYCDLDKAETEALLDRGLLVLDDTHSTNLYSCYYQLYLDGSPVYITADAMLYLWYEAHREAMKQAEREVLRPQLIELTDRLLQQTQALRAQQDDPRLRENAIMLAVVRDLLEPQWEPPQAIADDVADEVRRVMEHALVQLYPGEDYTQYEVRGYYTESEELSTYFRGAKYLARRYLRVADPEYPADATRELQRATLLALALREGEGLIDLYKQIYDLRAFLAGPADTIRLDQLAGACAAAWGDQWLRDDIGDLRPLREELSSDRYPTTRINTRVSYDPAQMMSGKKIVTALGEHYIPDSDLFMHTCEPAIMYRHLPTGLDVATALGSDEAARKLREVAAAFPQVVPAAREFGPKMTGEGIYGAWLDTLRTLFDEPEGLPEFAQTAAWDDKQINACLTSWAHLRHNYILYGAQAYTVMGFASGGGIVEPLPEFFAGYAKMCEALRERLADEGIEGRVVRALAALQAKAETFARCAADQLAGRDTSWADGEIHDFSGFIRQVFFDSPLIVADVCTSSETHEVLHAASGPFHPIVVLAEEDGDWYAAVGYVGSYYEFAEPDFGRVTDEEWRQRVEARYARPEPPEWLAALYGPVPPEQSAARQRLREIEETLNADLDAGLGMAEQFTAEHRYDRWEPAAALIAAQALLDAERYQRVADLLSGLDGMYGCDACDAARRVLGQADWHLKRADRQESERQSLEEALKPTAPREGLSPEEEVERQDRRAEILITQSDDALSLGRRVQKNWRRMLDECPQSHYVPLAELGLVRAEFHEDEIYAASDPESFLAAIAERVRPRLEELAEKYAGTPWEIPMRTALLSTWLSSGDYQTAWTRVKPLLAADTPDPGEHAAALKWLGRLNWDFASRLKPGTDPRRLIDVLLDVLPGEALAEGNVPVLKDLVAVAEEHNLPEYGGSTRSMLRMIAYYSDAPDAFADFGPCLAAEYSDRVQAEMTPERTGDLGQRALQVAEDHPETKTARAALVWAVMMGWRGDKIPAIAKVGERARERLQERYPDSLENLMVQFRHLNSQKRWDEAIPLFERMKERMEGLDREDLPAPLHHLAYLDDPAERKQTYQKMVAARREKYGDLARAAGLPDDFLAEADSTKAIVEALLERLPERQFEVLDTYDDLRHISSLVRSVLRAHPDDPRAIDMHWTMGGRSNLLAIAAGPGAPHFDEAVAKFENTWPQLDYRRSLREELVTCRRDADDHRGTPAEVLSMAAAGRAYLRKNRPEQAVEFLESALERIGEGRLLRDRLVDLLTAARREVSAKRGPRPTRLWQVPLEVKQPGVREAYDSSLPSIHGKGILVRGKSDAGGHALVCLDADSGEVLWDAPTAKPRQITVEGDAVVVATEAGLVYCIAAATGEMRWTHEMGLTQTGAVACDASGDVVTALWDQGLLTALDLQTGKPLWEADLLPQKTRYGLHPAVIHAELAFAWDRANVLHAFSLADGSEAWSWDLADVVEDDRRLTDAMPSSPAVIGGRLLVPVGGTGKVMAALDPVTGELFWSREWSFSHSWPVWLPMLPLSGDRFISRTAERLVCAATADGSRQWSLPTERIFGLVGAGDLLVLALSDGVVVIDAKLHQVVARFPGIGASQGLQAEQRDGVLRIIAAGPDRIEAWEIALH